MMDPVYLKYLNIQYWYCFFYSIFGGKCTEAEVATVTVNGELTGDASTSGNVGFWEWLFGSSGSASAGAPTLHSGPFGFLADAVFFVANLIGALVSFIWSIYSFLAYSVSALLFLGIIGLLAYLFSIRFGEGALYGALPPAETTVHPLRERWNSLLDGARSNDPKRWRQGILEADMMLGEMLEKLGYAGKDTSEQIVLVPENAFVTLPFAWEAHRIRNFVGASSSSYILTQQEAFRVMKLYEQVFQEFAFI